MIRVIPIVTKKELKDFITFPDKLYKGNPYRVPPLHQYEKSTLDKTKNPAFDYCEAKYWIAYKDNKIVGRIAGIINHKSNTLKNEKYVRFGWIDFIDDDEVASLLMQAVETWGKEMGLTHVHGPLGFTDMDLEGMLIEGFSEVGTQAVLYNYPYYPMHIEKNGYVKSVDWVQYEIKIPESIPEKFVRVSELIKNKYDLHVLKAKKASELLPFADRMFETLNESFKNLYGFVPLTEKQKAYYTRQYFSMINPKYVCFVLNNKDEVVGFGLSVLSLSKAFIKSKGKLFPFGFIHILKALQKNDTVDMLLQGVKPGYHNKGIPSIFYAELMRAYIDNGIKTAISSHALETNINAFSMFNDFENRRHLRRRCYVKEIGK